MKEAIQEEWLTRWLSFCSLMGGDGVVVKSTQVLDGANSGNTNSKTPSPSSSVQSRMDFVHFPGSENGRVLRIVVFNLSR